MSTVNVIQLSFSMVFFMFTCYLMNIRVNAPYIVKESFGSAIILEQRVSQVSSKNKQVRMRRNGREAGLTNCFVNESTPFHQTYFSREKKTFAFLCALFFCAIEKPATLMEKNSVHQFITKKVTAAACHHCSTVQQGSSATHGGAKENGVRLGFRARQLGPLQQGTSSSQQWRALR